jgi:ABC-2 type transport system permease protein
MRNIWTIAKREYDLYFISPVAYVVAFLFLTIVGLIFAINIVGLTLSQFGAAPAPDPRIVTGPMAFLMLLATPALTMRLLADEVRMGTMELLLTAPVRDFELVVGKWLGAFLFMLTLIAASLVFPLMMQQLADPGIDQMLMISGYLGVILLASAFLAVGVGISAIFSNQVAAFFTTMVTFVILWWLIGAPANILPGGSDIFRYLDMSGHFYNSFNEGKITLSGLTYYLSLTALGLFIGTTAIETRRWR